MVPPPLMIDRSASRSATPAPRSSFLLHAERAEERSASPPEILQELGRRKVVGGQEDMIIDVAVELSRRAAAAQAARA